MTARSPLSPSFAPNGNAQTYKDVLRFESRLIQNAERLTLQRRKFQGPFILLGDLANEG